MIIHGVNYDVWSKYGVSMGHLVLIARDHRPTLDQLLTGSG